MTRHAFLLLAIAALQGCGSSSTLEPVPEAAGEIVRVGAGLWSGDPSGPFQVHVIFEPSDRCGVIFTVDGATDVTDARSVVPTPASADILVAGAWVLVDYNLVATSCPGQSYADSVTRLR